MEQRRFFGHETVSVLTLGGGGLGQLWGPTTRDEAVATVRRAAELGIDLIDVAPLYGNGEAERVVGLTFDGSLPIGMRVETKCGLGSPPAAEVYERSIKASGSPMPEIPQWPMRPSSMSRSKAGITAVESSPKPAVIQCITNPLNSAGGLKRFDGELRGP